jgi:osmotically-inducible protein OsmY
VQTPKDFTMTRTFNRIAASALFALTAGAFLPAHAAGNDADLAGQVQAALSSKLGSDAKDLTVTADNGSITLHGWAQGPQEEAKARYVASTVPGVHNAYSSVRTFSTDSNE